MEPRKFPFALIVFLAFIAVIPAWIFFTLDYTTLRVEDAWMAGLVLPAAIFMFITSWVKPELSGLVMGGFLIAGVMVLAPWFFKFVDMGAQALTDSPLAQLGIQIAVPLLIITFVVTVGIRRMGQVRQ